MARCEARSRKIGDLVMLKACLGEQPRCDAVLLLVCLLGRHGLAALFYPASERCRLLSREAVKRNVGGIQGQSPIEVRFPVTTQTNGQPEDQVDADVRDPCGPGGGKCPRRTVSAMHAAHPLE